MEIIYMLNSVILLKQDIADILKKLKSKILVSGSQMAFSC